MAGGLGCTLIINGNREYQKVTQSNEFEAGNIVKLKSGGPEMTVQEEVATVSGARSGKYWCQWFAGKKLERGNFPADSIELVKKEDEK
jgi:uncharacterized protein YodC (DUF2158 family)